MALPLPHVAESVAEVARASRELGADGFTLPTNTGGVYLGDPILDPVMAELDRHAAVVTLHPNRPSAVPTGVCEVLPIPFMEFLFDSTRAVVNMMMRGVFQRYAAIRFVIPHAGAFLPVLADRIAPVLARGVEGRLDVMAGLGNLYYDPAGFCLPRRLTALLSLVGTDHLVYGSDWPYTPEPVCVLPAPGPAGTGLLSDAERRRVFRGNAPELFPRLREAD